MHCAAEFGHAEILEFLLNKGCDVNVVNNPKETPLHFAAYHNKAKCAEILIKHKADVTLKNKFNETAKDLAKARHPKLVPILEKKLLKNHAATLFKPNSNDQTKPHERINDLPKDLLQEIGKLMNLKDFAAFEKAMGEDFFSGFNNETMESLLKEKFEEEIIKNHLKMWKDNSNAYKNRDNIIKMIQSKSSIILYCFVQLLKAWLFFKMLKKDCPEGGISQYLMSLLVLVLPDMVTLPLVLVAPSVLFFIPSMLNDIYNSHIKYCLTREFKENIDKFVNHFLVKYQNKYDDTMHAELTTLIDTYKQELPESFIKHIDKKIFHPKPQ